MTKPDDPRLEDEARLEKIRRRIDAAVQDAPQLAKIALEAMIRDHNPELKGSADSAGRAGMRSGKVSELTAMGTLKPGGAERLQRIFDLTNGNMDGAQKVSTLHDMRFVFFDNNTRLLFATAYDGDWDTYINDFVTKIPDLMNLLFDNLEGWPGITSPKCKDYILGLQINASGWFVANPQVTVVDCRRLQRTEEALDTFLDAMSTRQDLDPDTLAALDALTENISQPEGVDY
ncbi:hypothetical protein LH51_09775 [Nitrincola sp. A-D6]|uniref:hypothetical protein n=1 Tax=Nitrincola sp. A-D6 TaxID=1545442 RepID=UPI00051FDC1E|nr:hypothetical protein [Nitrincola sp. A-D6]KGK42112.1 hypothetical protein LH51_09775 [Nitrincola sp. A-D6]